MGPQLNSTMRRKQKPSNGCSANPAAVLAVSSTKPITGHLLGACGAVELAITSLALYHQWIPPTINLTEPEPAFCLDCVPQHGRSCEIDIAMSNNYSFGGRNSSLVIKRFIE